MDSIDYEHLCNELERQDLDEDFALYIVTSYIAEKNGRPPDRKRTWAESRLLKRQLTRDREFFDSRRSAARGNGKGEAAGPSRLS
eukprot:11200712-Lingulodinium_polyedra.AAC.1